MPLIDKSYFIGELNIPQAHKPEVGEALDLFIKKYEAQFLTYLLGYPMYKVFTAALLVDPIDAMWLNLRDGFDYVNTYGYETRWKGLRIAETKESPIANYIYWHWLRDQHEQNSAIGVIKPKGENSTNVSPANKMVRAWNEMVDWVHGLEPFIVASVVNAIPVYPLWDKRNHALAFSEFRYQNTLGI